MPLRALDSHCHADHLQKNTVDFPDIYLRDQIAAISWSYLQEVNSYLEYSVAWYNQEKTCATLSGFAVPFFYLVGIHPRSIAQDFPSFNYLPKDVLRALQRHAGNPNCLGLGELGLESGDEKEKQILYLQLQWARDNLPANKRIGIHTPRRDKAQITRLILEILEDFPSLQDCVVIDHVQSENLQMLLPAKYNLGMTLQEGKVSISELKSLINNNPGLDKRVMLNSDSLHSLSRPYLQMTADRGILTSVREDLLLNNALNFYDLPKTWKG